MLLQSEQSLRKSKALRPLKLIIYQNKAIEILAIYYPAGIISKFFWLDNSVPSPNSEDNVHQ